MSHGRPDPTLSAFIMINSFYCTSTGAPFHSPHHLPSKVTGTIPGLHPFSFRVSGPWGSSYWPLTTQLFVHLPQALHSQQSHCGPAGWWGWGGGVGSGIQIILFFFQVHPSHCWGGRRMPPSQAFSMCWAFFLRQEGKAWDDEWVPYILPFGGHKTECLVLGFIFLWMSRSVYSRPPRLLQPVGNVWTSSGKEWSVPFSIPMTRVEL